MTRFLLAALFALVLMPRAVMAAPFTIIITELETPLVPNSVIELAEALGYYKAEGVEVKILRVGATPSAVAALRSNQGDMANLGFDIALQLVARGQMKLRGVISPDKALPFIIVSKTDIKSPKALEKRIMGIGRIGSVDYVQTRNVLEHYQVDVNSLRYLPLGQPGVRGQALVAGQIDATAVTVGTWLTLPNKTNLHVLVNQADYFAAAPFITKLSVVTEDTAKKRAKEIEGVVRATIKASRDFAAKPELWVNAMVKARPDVKRAELETLAAAYAPNWSVNGGLDAPSLAYTTDGMYQNEELKDMKTRVAPAEWIDTSFIDTVLKAMGTAPAPAPAK